MHNFFFYSNNFYDCSVSIHFLHVSFLLRFDQFFFFFFFTLKSLVSEIMVTITLLSKLEKICDNFLRLSLKEEWSLMCLVIAFCFLVELLEYKLQQESVVQDDLRKSLRLERGRVSELSQQSSRERARTLELQAELSETQIGLSKARDALEREQQRFSSVT